MIGTVAEFTMADDGSWSGPDDLYVRFLNLHYAPSDPRFAATGRFGVNALRAAAEDMGEAAAIDPSVLVPLPKGVIP